MSFAAKLKKNENIKLTAHKLSSLTITNIALGQQQTKGSLYILSKQTQQWILVVELKRDINTSYNCAVKLLLDESHSEELIAQYGEIHIIGNIQPIHPPQRSQDFFVNFVTITRKDQTEHSRVEKVEGSVENEETKVGKVQGRPKRSVNFKGNTAIQPKAKPKNQDSSTSKKPKSLLEMMKNIDKEKDSDESDDQSYEQESQEDDSDESQNEEQDQQAKKSKKIKKKSKNLTKKSSWAQMLHQQMKAQSGSDSEEESEQDQEQLVDKAAKMKTTKETIKVIPAEKKQKVSSKVVSNQEAKKPSLFPQNGDEDSSSFQFAIPNGLPNFLKDK